MKKLAIISIILLMSVGFAFADDFDSYGEDPMESPFTVTATTGAYYDAYPLSPSAWAILEALFNLRGGSSINLMAKLGGGLSVGAELGFQGMYITYNDTLTYVSFDVPARAVVSFSPGEGLEFSAFGGILWAVFLGSDFDASLYLDAGARLGFGTWFIEASYEMPLGAAGFNPINVLNPIHEGFIRVGMGSLIEIVR